MRAAGSARLAARLGAMLALLAVCAPMHGLWRLAGRGRVWPRLFLAGVGWVAGLRVQVRGTPAAQALMIANHVSWLDIFALAGQGRAAFVAHSGLAGNNALRILCEMNDTVFVRRDDRLGVGRQIAQVRKALALTPPLAIFPEGTTSDGCTLLPFKSALLAAAVPLPPDVVVQPVLLAYDDAPEMAWVGDEPGLRNARRILERRDPIRLTLMFLAPLAPDDSTDRKTIAAAAHAAMDAALASRRSAR